MIVVTVDLHSAIDGRIERRGTVVIDNISGGGAKRSYRARAYKRGDERNGIPAMIRHCQPFRTGTVKNHPAQAENIWNLVGKALASMGFSTAAPEAQGALIRSAAGG